MCRHYYTCFTCLLIQSFQQSYLISDIMYVFRWRKPRHGKVKLLSTFPLLVSVMLSVNFSPLDLDGPCVPVWGVWPLFWKWWEPKGFEAGKLPDMNRFIGLEKSLWRLGQRKHVLCHRKNPGCRLEEYSFILTWRIFLPTSSSSQWMMVSGTYHQQWALQHHKGQMEVKWPSRKPTASQGAPEKHFYSWSQRKPSWFPRAPFTIRVGFCSQVVQP